MLETLVGQARVLVSSLTRTAEEHPWLWVLLIVITLVLLIRRQRPGSLR